MLRRKHYLRWKCAFFACIAEGNSNKEIAAPALGHRRLGEGSRQKHLSKLGANDRAPRGNDWVKRGIIEI
jgi:hypothetical protein